MKKLIILIAFVLIAFILSACSALAPSKGCDNYWNLNKVSPYSYMAINTCTGETKDIISNEAKEIYDKFEIERSKKVYGQTS